jgi:hypothetical protein
MATLADEHDPEKPLLSTCTAVTMYKKDDDNQHRDGLPSGTTVAMHGTDTSTVTFGVVPTLLSRGH